METFVIRKHGDFPHWLKLEYLADFLNENMKPYQDSVPDIIRGLNYAMSEEKNAGGFIAVAFEEKTLKGAIVILKTGMSGYIPENILLFVGVRPELRGQGIGGRLIEMAKQECEGDIKLHVEHDNPARRLYERQGFSSKYLEMRLSNN